MNRQALADKLRKSPASERDFMEQYHRVPEVAQRLGVKPITVRRELKGAPGIKYLGQSGSSRKRSYTTMLIPESTIQWLLDRLSTPRSAS
jgi:hypothetical protein